MEKDKTFKFAYVRGWELDYLNRTEDRSIWKPELQKMPDLEGKLIRDKGVLVLDPENPPEAFIVTPSGTLLREQPVIFPGSMLYNLNLVSPAQAGYIVEDFKGLRAATEDDFFLPICQVIYESDFEAESAFMFNTAHLAFSMSERPEEGQGISRTYNSMKDRAIENTRKNKGMFLEGKILKSRRYFEKNRDADKCNLPALIFNNVQIISLAYREKTLLGKKVLVPEITNEGGAETARFLKSHTEIYLDDDAIRILSKRHPKYMPILEEVLK